MRRSIILAVAAAAAGLGIASSASAQRVGVEIYAGPSTTYDTYDARTNNRYGPRVHGYTPAPDDVEMELDRPTGSGGCGTYRYWNGDKCVDARNQ